MNCLVDAKFLFPPLLNLVVFCFFLKSQDGQSWSFQDGGNHILLYPILKLQFPFLSLAVSMLLLFLLTAIRVTLSVGSPMSRCCKGHTAATPPAEADDQVEVEGERIQNLKPSSSGDLV
ncbi:hypothetical protein WN943_029130 [Citrus x changshan-huyou]